MHKRLFDFVVAAIALTSILPLLIICVAIIKLTGRGPAFFVQERVGLNWRRFRMLKLRTMTAGTSKDGPHLTTRNDARVTTFGGFLRKRKLDELPQLINVLRGDMSIIGPRPELPRYVEMFRKDYETVLRVKPGITDYASIEFKDESELLESPETYEKRYVEGIMPAKMKLYKEYVAEQSWKVDLRILMRTMASLVKT